MPTDLPPDYKPAPIPTPPTPGEDALDPTGDPRAGVGKGTPGPAGDVVDPPGWAEPAIAPGGNPIGVPTPAGTPTF